MIIWLYSVRYVVDFQFFFLSARSSIRVLCQFTTGAHGPTEQPAGSKPEGLNQTLPDPGQSTAVPDLYHHPAMRAAATAR